MLVDDEPDILLMLEHYLKGHGFRFSSFSDPLKALADFKENASKYDLVLTDIRMPNMRGDELANHISFLNPKIKIVLMSAFEVHDEAMKKANSNECMVDVLQKPFSMTEFGYLLDKHLA
jgi:DNA-binding NtrC family response regulator